MGDSNGVCTREVWHFGAGCPENPQEEDVPTPSLKMHAEFLTEVREIR
jgi:hypothetical protein